METLTAVEEMLPPVGLCHLHAEAKGSSSLIPSLGENAKVKIIFFPPLLPSVIAPLCPHHLNQTTSALPHSTASPHNGPLYLSLHILVIIPAWRGSKVGLHPSLSGRLTPLNTTKDADDVMKR